MPESKKSSVGVFVFDGVEVLDFAGPIEVFSSLWSDRDEKGESHPLFDVITIGESDRPVTCFGGLQVIPKATIGNHPPLDVLVVPGGNVSDVVKNLKILEWIDRQNKNTKITASVCTGAFLLAKCGLLNKQKATTHWSALDSLRKNYPEIQVQEKVRFVDNGHIITSAGISAGIDMSLHIVERLYGKKMAEDAAHGMEYEWKQGQISFRDHSSR